MIKSVIKSVIGNTGNAITGKASGSWSSYWLTRYISTLAVATTSDTTQTITATIVGTGYDGVSFEYSTDGITYSEHGTSATGTYLATGLTAGTQYYWRARLYKGINYGSYSEVRFAMTTMLTDTNTVAWYDSQDLTTITKDGSEHVSEWKNKLGVAASDLNVLEGTPHWSLSGISFDGIGDKLKTGAFTYNQPEYFYLVIKINAWAAGGRIVDGNSTNGGSVYMVTSTPKIGIYAGTAVSFVNSTLGSFVIIRGLFSGAASRLIENSIIPVIGNAGANNMGGITLATFGSDPGVTYVNMQLKEAIFRKINDSLIPINEITIWNYLANKYSLSIFEQKIGDQACWGRPKILADPNNSGKYIVTWQMYGGAGSIDTDVLYSVWDSATNTYTPPAHVFNDVVETRHQGHPNWGYFGGKYHVSFAQSTDDVTFTDGKLVDLESVTWAGFANHILTPPETAATAEIGTMPHHTYLEIDADTVWLLYCATLGGKIYIAYAIWDSSTGWDATEHKIVETEISDADINHIFTNGTAVKDGANIFVYYTNRVTAKIMVVKSTDSGGTWGVPADTGATGCGISSRGMVQKYGTKYIMVYNSSTAITIAKSADGLTFSTIKVLKPCYSYFADYVILDANNINIVWAQRDAIGEGGTAKNNLFGFKINLGTYLTT